jgi:sigma-B regulation protein RsbU (phosphoserine phosphatase)
MSSISRGSFSGTSLIEGPVYTARGGPRGDGVLGCRVPPPPGVKTPLPSEILADLLALVGEINAVLDPDELLPTIARNLRRIVDYRILDIFLPDPDGFLAPAYVEGYDLELASRFRVRVGEGIVGAAAAAREPVFVPDVSKDPRYISFFPDVVAELAIPLVSKDHLVGVLNIEGPAVELFTPAARTALQVLAGHLAVAIENATLYRETRWYAGLLATLHEIGKETASILDLDVLLQRLAEIVKRVIDYEMFGILLLDEERDELVLRKSVNFGLAKERTRIAVTEGLCGAAVRSREPVVVGDVRKDPRYVSLVPETRSELVVPLIHKDRVIGVLDLESPVLDRFTEQDVKVLTPLASQVAIAVENARLYAEIRKNEDRLGRELRIAREIQHALFPEGSPSGPGWEASAHFRPARELGGDLYDFYDMGSGHLGVATGDVAGKGVPAALYAAFASGTIRARAFERRAPADLMQRVNRSLRLANSGLPYPFHYRAAEKRAAPLEVSGLPLGTFDGVSYDEVSVGLAKGDVVVFYTDGLVEARRGRAEYGPERLLRGSRATPGAPPPSSGSGSCRTSRASSGMKARRMTSPSSSSRCSNYWSWRCGPRGERDHTASGGPRYTGSFDRAS